MTEQPSLLDWQPPEPFIAKGATFNQARDGARLKGQCLRVYHVMRRGEWETLESIAKATGDPEASISARLRDLRRFGFTIERNHVEAGLWRYRMTA